jgi:hypothetical protein
MCSLVNQNTCYSVQPCAVGLGSCLSSCLNELLRPIHFTAPRHSSPQDPHPVLCQQDGHARVHVQRQGVSDAWVGAHHGQAVAHLRQQRSHGRGAARGGRVANHAGQGDRHREIVL